MDNRGQGPVTLSDNGDGSAGNRLVPDPAAITGGLSSGGDLISSVVAGLLLGLGLDWWLGSRPVFIIIGTLAGFGSGFYRLWKHSETLEEQAKERRRGD